MSIERVTNRRKYANNGHTASNISPQMTCHITILTINIKIKLTGTNSQGRKLRKERTGNCREPNATLSTTVNLTDVRMLHIITKNIVIGYLPFLMFWLARQTYFTLVWPAIVFDLM